MNYKTNSSQYIAKNEFFLTMVNSNTLKEYQHIVSYISRNYIMFQHLPKSLTAKLQTILQIEIGFFITP
jgi:hypothetical protein